ncbi:GNAT family N-acetyltransferase [Aquimarina sp. AD10]|uniref:GNAT family N-acetyltransferase n=1 Tax=Aquimarina sp. AD10 TaxID=1714849 RepID=UPI000E50132A|nr:GNAT family N-acetyltransferase [Aquimarina sp. AD10]AXT61888.1 GNAT family N-acetyltransferase [Aquimarina sp. AD10]RKN02348.1 GNAT family N-acetyltransferase [Aquimarina sp. AD10]
MSVNFRVKQFEEIEALELYKILRLRAEVFVVEQDCVYQDIDNKDQKALHVIGYKNDQIVAYTRLFKGGDYFENASIGRVVVSQKERQFGYGHDLIKASIEAIEKHFKTTEIKISAQTYLKKFYESHGFSQIGEEYLEDGIPHIAMVRR